MVDLSIKNPGSFHSYVHLPEGSTKWEHQMAGTCRTDRDMSGFKICMFMTHLSLYEYTLKSQFTNVPLQVSIFGGIFHFQTQPILYFLYAYGSFSKWRYPNSWMVYFMENPILKWMILGSPHFRKPPDLHFQN